MPDMFSKRCEQQNIQRHAASQLGLSLIELMISLGLGLFIVAGIFQVTVGSRQAFEVIQAQSLTQESGRFATRFIADSAVNAGYINLGAIDAQSGDDFAQSLVDSFDFQSITDYWPAEEGFVQGAVVFGADNAAANGFADAKADSDLLSIRMQGDASYDSSLIFSMRDCEGIMMSADPAVRTIVNYYIDDDNNLVCRADTLGATDSTGNVAELVSGIESMQVVYGVNDSSGTSFLNASDMTADNWVNVSAIRIAMLGVSENKPLDSAGGREHFMLSTTVDDVGDGRLRQVFYQTIALRNR